MDTLSQQEIFVSVVLTVKNQRDALMAFLPSLGQYLQNHYSDFEIVIIDRFSNDGTEQSVAKLLTERQSVRYIRLSKPVENDIAIAAGLENAIGDYVVYMDCRSDPIEMVAELVQLGKNGAEIIIGTSKAYTTPKYRLLKRLSSRLIEGVGYGLPSNSTGSFCLSRQAVNAVTESSRYYWRPYVTMTHSGYAMTAYEYRFTTPRPKKRIIDGLRESRHYLVFNSTKPLRWMSLLGLFGSAMAFVFALYSVLANLVAEQVVEGWTTTILFMSFLFSILFMMLSFFGEYLARLLDDRSDHALYNVLYEKHSSVMVETHRQNVSFTATAEDAG